MSKNAYEFVDKLIGLKFEGTESSLGNPVVRRIIGALYKGFVVKEVCSERDFAYIVVYLMKNGRQLSRVNVQSVLDGREWERAHSSQARRRVAV